MRLRRAMLTVDEALVRASVPAMLAVVRDVERWPERLPPYRRGRVRQRAAGGGGGGAGASVRFRHIGGVTQGMEVEWRLTPREGATRVTLVHAWDGPGWPLIGVVAATAIIGPVFVHGIASRTLAGLARGAGGGG